MYTRLLSVLLLICLSPFALAADGPGADRPLDSILDNGAAPKEAEPDKAAEDETKGDMVSFEIKTDKDIRNLKEGMIYKSAGSTFKVSHIAKQGTDGGKFTIQRIAGAMDPDRKLQYAGPKSAKPEEAAPPLIVATYNILDYYIMGGFFLHPIAALGLVMILFAANCVWLYRRSLQIPGKFTQQARKLLRDGQIEEFEDLALKSKGLFPGICRAISDRFDTSTADDIKERMQVAAAGQINRLRFPVKFLNLVAVAAPLLGLLGTIIGMAMVFEAVASAQGAAKAAALAAGIRVKLFATAMALMVAIPALFLYFIFSSRLGGIIADAEALSEEFMHEVSMLKRSSAPQHAYADATAEAYAPADLSEPAEVTDAALPPRTSVAVKPQPRAPIPQARIPQPRTRSTGKDGQ